jgi:fumarate reductase flavoprotein subunit
MRSVFRRRKGTAYLIAVVLMATLSSLILAFRFAKTSMAGSHLVRGITCGGCHGKAGDKPLAQLQSCLTCKQERRPVAQRNCMSCHGSYRAVAARTRNFTSNPHQSHRGETECKVCHKGHKPDVISCSTAACHPAMTFRRKKASQEQEAVDVF